MTAATLGNRFFSATGSERAWSSDIDGTFGPPYLTIAGFFLLGKVFRFLRFHVFGFWRYFKSVGFNVSYNYEDRSI